MQSTLGKAAMITLLDGWYGLFGIESKAPCYIPDRAINLETQSLDRERCIALQAPVLFNPTIWTSHRNLLIANSTPQVLQTPEEYDSLIQRCKRDLSSTLDVSTVSLN